MEFGKRFSRHNGHIRERGRRIVCKACAGTGRTTVKAERRA
jgi:hypothetical protein